MTAAPSHPPVCSLRVLLLAVFLVGLLLQSSPAFAHSCPLELYKIDRAIALKPPLSAEVLKKVIALRDEGEKLHRQEKHGEAMLVLGSAKRLLGID